MLHFQQLNDDLILLIVREMINEFVGEVLDVVLHVGIIHPVKPAMFLDENRLSTGKVAI